MTERQRAILEAVLDDDPGQQCAGCGNADVDDWRLANKGTWLTHGSSDPEDAPKVYCQIRGRIGSSYAKRGRPRSDEHAKLDRRNPK